MSYYIQGICNRCENPTGDGTSICDSCYETKVKPYNDAYEGNIVPINKTYVKGYGHVEDSRLREMERRVILPESASDGGYYLGRRMENGKISENKQPTY